MDFSLMATFRSWGNALNTPFGYALLVGVAIYIFLRVTGRIRSPIPAFNKAEGGGAGQDRSTGGNRQPDYIIK